MAEVLDGAVARYGRVFEEILSVRQSLFNGDAANSRTCAGIMRCRTQVTVPTASLR